MGDSMSGYVRLKVIGDHCRPIRHWRSLNFSQLGKLNEILRSRSIIFRGFRAQFKDPYKFLIFIVSARSRRLRRISLFSTLISTLFFLFLWDSNLIALAARVR